VGKALIAEVTRVTPVAPTRVVSRRRLFHPFVGRLEHLIVRLQAYACATTHKKDITVDNGIAGPKVSKRSVRECDELTREVRHTSAVERQNEEARAQARIIFTGHRRRKLDSSTFQVHLGSLHRSDADL
jgi:hypothetical protein